MEIDAARVTASTERITLNLFVDVCVIAERERATDSAGGGVQWEGRIPGPPAGTATLVRDGDVIVGTIRLDGELYEIRYAGEGVHVIMNVDVSKFPRE